MEDKLNRKINFVSEGLKDLSGFIKEYDESLKDDEILRRRLFLMIKRQVEEITETVIKINMILLKERGSFPKSYKNSFLDLIKYYNLDKKLLEEIAFSAIFRNELAHEYIDMSEEYAIKNSKKILKLYPKYLLKIGEIINN